MSRASTKSLRIGVDFDGTIADSSPQKIAFAIEMFRMELRPEDCGRPQGVAVLGADRYDTMIRSIYGTDLTLQMEPMAGAVEVLKRMCHKHEVTVLTARYDNELTFVRQWLALWNLDNIPAVNVNERSKVEMAQKLRLDIFLDDTVGVARQLAVEGRHVYLLNRPYTVHADVSEPVQVVDSWYDFELRTLKLIGGSVGHPG